MDFDSIMPLIWTILVVCVGVAVVKKAIGCAITLVAIAIIAYLLLSFVGAGGLS